MFSKLSTLAVLLFTATAYGKGEWIKGHGGQGGKALTTDTPDLIDNCGAFKHKFDISCAAAPLTTATIPVVTMPGEQRPGPTGEMTALRRLGRRHHTRHETGGDHYTGVPPAPTGAGAHVCNKIKPAHFEGDMPVDFEIYPCYLVGTKSWQWPSLSGPTGSAVIPTKVTFTPPAQTDLSSFASLVVSSSGYTWSGEGTHAVPSATGGA